MGLNETTDGELKTTLSSVVQLAYARLHAEPDDTLHRLKYLLEKLRQRIVGVSHRQTVIHIKSVNNGDEDGNDDDRDGKNREKIMSRTKRSPVYGIAEIERIDDDNSVYSNSLSYVKNRPIIFDTTTAAVPTISPPNDKTIHKVLHFQDQNSQLYPVKIISNGWKIHSKIKPVTTTRAPGVFDVSKPTVFYPPIKVVPPASSLLGPIYSTENEIMEQSPSVSATKRPENDEPTVEHIANAIVKLLYPLQSPTEFPPQAIPPQEFKFPDHKHLFEHKLALIKRPEIQQPTSTEEMTTKTADLVFDDEVRTTSAPTTTNVPPLFKIFAGNESNLVAAEADDKFLDVKTKSENLTKVMTSTIAPQLSSPPVLQIMEELQTSNILKAPAAFLNGTRDGFVQFVTTLSTLSFATKMVIIFAISISILSILLGVYSLGPPIIAVGILGIMIPICILLLLQDSHKNGSSSSSSSSNPNRVGLAEAKINWNDQVVKILNLIDQAVEKYDEFQKS